MTIAEFRSKSLASNEDAVATVKSNAFEALLTFIGSGDDLRTVVLFRGLWLARDTFTQKQLLAASVTALFPSSASMRCGTAVIAMMFAKATGCEGELQSVVKSRWRSLNGRECTEVVLGLSGYEAVAGWLSLIPTLFDMNEAEDVRTQLVKAVSNIVRSREIPEARLLLVNLLQQMPQTLESYSNPNNHEFINSIKESL